jgi:hypothetical protein
MEFTLETKQQLEALLAKPSRVGQEHIPMLQNLIKTYPYYQPLYLLLAKAGVGSADENIHFANAALRTNGNILHKVIFEAQSLKPVDNLNLVSYERVVKSNEIVEAVAETIVEKPTIVVPPAPEIENLAPLEAEVIAVCSNEQSIATVETDEQETFDEIGELVIPIIEEIETVTASPVEEDLAVESIASSDFFAFEKNFNSEELTEEKPSQTQNTYQAEENIISKYDDDKLPYTFLWWLAKTRKDHEQIFRPYVSATRTKLAQAGELQHQYVENIFHIQAPLEPLSESETQLTRANSREDDIIYNFIKNEPQIKVPKPDQINNENKAKKSAEDNYDLVSETLAEIYIEQMLYHKAIDTYQKLSLKFPEKSGYFADLIQSLEKKI